jgi:hypothetical protein
VQMAYYHNNLSESQPLDHFTWRSFSWRIL